jgi:hypothetical protein
MADRERTVQRHSRINYLRADGAFTHVLALPRISALALMASCLLFAQQQSTTQAAPQETNPNAPPSTNEPRTR